MPGVYDLHVWTISSGFVALSAHLTCVEPSKQEAQLRAARDVLGDRFGIRHTTIQIDRDPSCRGTPHTAS